jgi:hypothetical protein
LFSTLVPVIWIATLCCQPSTDSTEPASTHGLVSECGAPVDGISVSFALDRSDWSIGDTLTFDATLRSEATPWRAPFLETMGGEGTASFRDVESGAQFVRGVRDFSPFGWTLCPESQIALDGPEFAVPSFVIPLLETDGSQLPPGEYDVVFRYENSGGDGTRRTCDEHGEVIEELHPEAFWAGVIESGPARIRVTDRASDVRDAVLPRAIRVSRGAWEFDEWRPLRIASRPGYTVWFRWAAGCYPPDAAEALTYDALVEWGARNGRLQGGSSGLPRVPEEGVFHPSRCASVAREERPSLVVAVEVLESAAPLFDSPTAGDSRVLESYTLEAAVSELEDQPPNEQRLWKHN